MTTTFHPITGAKIDADLSNVHYGQMLITPGQAKQILAERNTNNRTVSLPVVDRYARDMAMGRWQLNGDPLRFSTDGVLLDGQHRLAAIIRAGVSVRMFVVWNLPAETQATMDDGRKRTMADVLELTGQGDHAKTVASVLRRAIAWMNGDVVTSGYNAASKQEMQTFYEHHPEILTSAQIADSVRSAKGVRCAPSTLGLAHWLFSQVDRADADEFLSSLRSGAGLEEGDPVLVLRNKLSTDGSTRLRTESADTLAWFIKAWNAKRSGKKIKLLRYTASEDFPEPC